MDWKIDRWIDRCQSMYWKCIWDEILLCFGLPFYFLKKNAFGMRLYCSVDNFCCVLFCFFVSSFSFLIVPCIPVSFSIKNRGFSPCFPTLQSVHPNTAVAFFWQFLFLFFPFTVRASKNCFNHTMAPWISLRSVYGLGFRVQDEW